MPSGLPSGCPRCPAKGEWRRRRPCDELRGTLEGSCNPRLFAAVDELFSGGSFKKWAKDSGRVADVYDEYVQLLPGLPWTVETLPLSEAQTAKYREMAAFYRTRLAKATTNREIDRLIKQVEPWMHHSSRRPPRSGWRSGSRPLRPLWTSAIRSSSGPLGYLAETWSLVFRRQRALDRASQRVDLLRRPGRLDHPHPSRAQDAGRPCGTPRGLSVGNPR